MCRFVCYPEVEIKLVFFIGDIKNGDGDNGGVSVVISPMGEALWQCKDIALAEPPELLVAIAPRPMFSSSFTSAFTSFI